MCRTEHRLLMSEREHGMMHANNIIFHKFSEKIVLSKPFRPRSDRSTAPRGAVCSGF